jgi:TRAP-type mannitol/chloroaromatic compound transport system substrate-binding protein
VTVKRRDSIMRVIKIMFIIMILIMLPFALCTGGAQEKEVITLVGQCQFWAGSIEYDSFKRACDLINLQSAGRLVVKANSAGSIVAATKQFDAVDSGALDFAMDTSAYWRDKWLVAPLFDMGIAGMSAAEHYLWFLEGGGVELAREMVGDKYNVHIIDAAVLYPPEIFLNSVKPINSLNDIKGLRIRTAGDDGEVFSEMGASLTMIPGGELYEAMSRGTIDAFQYMSPAGDACIGLDEVVKYLYLSPMRQPCSMSMVIVNKSKWEKLPADLQEIIQTSFLSEAWHFYGRIAQADAEAIQKYKDKGVEVSQPPKDVEDAMKKLSEEMYKERATKDPFYAKVYESKLKWEAIIDSVYNKL